MTVGTKNDLKKWSSIFAIITAFFVAFNYVADFGSGIYKAANNIELIDEHEKRLDSHDSLHETSNWRKKRTDRKFNEMDSVFKILKQKKILD